MKFTTIKQIEKHVLQVKKATTKLQEKFPNVSILSYSIDDLDIDLFYKIEAKNKENRAYSMSSSEKIEFNNDRLRLWSWGLFAMPVVFQSIKVMKNRECIERKEFTPIKETV